MIMLYDHVRNFVFCNKRLFSFEFLTNSCFRLYYRMNSFNNYCDGFKLVYKANCNGKIPVFYYESVNTSLTVILAEIVGPIVHGYFCLATEMENDDGLPHTLEHLVFLGSEDFPFKGVLDRLANRCFASGTNAWTDNDHTCYTLTTAGQDGFLQLLPIYMDHILFPTLKESGYVTEVHHINSRGEDAGIVYSEMQAVERTGESMINLSLLQSMYPGCCGYRYEHGGLMSNLQMSTSHEKVCLYHGRYYRPENLCLIITGLVTPGDVFRALKPVEEKMRRKGFCGPFTRPWQAEVPPLLNTLNHFVCYPSGEEEYGLVTTAWRGPAAKDQYKLEALNILLDYLSDSPISPIQQEFVEVDVPLCSEVEQFVLENKASCFGFTFRNADCSTMGDIVPRLKILLADIASGRRPFDVERLSNLIHRRVLDALNNLEEDSHDAVSSMLIGNFLFGDTENDFSDRLNLIDCRKMLMLEPESFWCDLLSLTQGTTSVSVIGQPSKRLVEQMGMDEAARVDEQRLRLGPEGLEECRAVLEKSVAANEVPVPEWVMKEVQVPDADKINLHHLSHSSNLPGRFGSPCANFPLDDIPFAFHLDAFNTRFAKLSVILDTCGLPDNLRSFLALFSEALVDSPLLRDGELIPHEQVIAELERDTQSYASGLGLPPGLFPCGSFPQLLTLELKVEAEKYCVGVRWLQELLLMTQFKAKRLKVIASRMLGDMSSYKRSGSLVVRTLMAELVFRKECNSRVTGMYRQAEFLTATLDRLRCQPDEVISDMNTIRHLLLSPSNGTVHVSCDPGDLSQRCEPALPWLQFLPSDCSHADGGSSPARSSMLDLVLAPSEITHRNLIVGVGDIESSYFLQTGPCVTSYDHEHLPAITVLIQYLTMSEGPMWVKIRGQGLSYSFSMHLRPDVGLLYLALGEASCVVESYVAARSVMQGYVNGTLEFTSHELEAAKSSLIFELIEDEKSVWDAAHESMLDYFRGVELGYNSSSDVLPSEVVLWVNRSMVRKVSGVSLSDVQAACQKYLPPFLDPHATRTVTCVHPSKVHTVKDEFLKCHPHTLHLHVCPPHEHV